MKNYYISIRPWAVYVKDEAFFIKQGGRTEPWGKSWVKIRARSIEDARQKGEARRGHPRTAQL